MNTSRVLLLRGELLTIASPSVSYAKRVGIIWSTQSSARNRHLRTNVGPTERGAQGKAKGGVVLSRQLHISPSVGMML